MKSIEIELTQGKRAIVCPCHEHMVRGFTWHYAQGYARTNMVDEGRWKIVCMNRVILGLPRGKDTDHINRNPLDNRCTNLRIVSRSRNKLNGDNYRTNTSGYKGVHKRKNGKYVATITVDKIAKYLGFFDTFEEAKAARLAAEAEVVY